MVHRKMKSHSNALKFCIRTSLGQMPVTKTPAKKRGKKPGKGKGKGKLDEDVTMYEEESLEQSVGPSPSASGDAEQHEGRGATEDTVPSSIPSSFLTSFPTLFAPHGPPPTSIPNIFPPFQVSSLASNPTWRAHPSAIYASSAHLPQLPTPVPPYPFHTLPTSNPTLMDAIAAAVGTSYSWTTHGPSSDFTSSSQPPLPPFSNSHSSGSERSYSNASSTSLPSVTSTTSTPLSPTSPVVSSRKTYKTRSEMIDPDLDLDSDGGGGAGANAATAEMA